MHVDIQPVKNAHVLRVFEDGTELGDPYIWVAVIQIEGETATLTGAMEAPTPDIWRAIRRAMRDRGVKRVGYTRRRADNPEVAEEHIVNVTRKRKRK